MIGQRVEFRGNMLDKRRVRQSEVPPIPQGLLGDLLRLGGTNDYGQPKLQIVHGTQAQWFRAGQIRLRYPIRQLKNQLVGYTVTNLESGEKEDYPATIQPVFDHSKYLVAPKMGTIEIGYPGWILEEWWPPEIVCGAVSINPETNERTFPGWEAARWAEHRGEKIDLLGPPPTEGQFRFLMYLDDGQDNPTPLDIGDGRISEIIGCAVKLRQAQDGADNWRGVQSWEKAARMQELLQRDRDKVTEADEKEFENMIRDVLESGYAAKMREQYLS